MEIRARLTVAWTLSTHILSMHMQLAIKFRTRQWNT